MSADLKAVVAHHEAGHAVAVLLRGGGLLRGIELSEQTHGEGITWVRHKPTDEWFITWAGPWAEARYAWGDRRLDEYDDEGLIFEDHLLGVMLTQPDDSGVIAYREDEQRDVLANVTGPGGAPVDVSGLIGATYDTWGRELSRVWPVIREVAARLIAGEAIGHDDVESLLRAGDEAGEVA